MSLMGRQITFRSNTTYGCFYRNLYGVPEASMFKNMSTNQDQTWAWIPYKKKKQRRSRIDKNMITQELELHT
jgi:hypothetical protein